MGDAERVARLALRFAPVFLLLTVGPMVVGVASGDGATGWPLAPGVLVAALFCWLSRAHRPPDDAALSENTAAVALAFPLAVLFSSAPYLTHGLGPLDAAFEGMSGITSTGLSRYDDIGEQPFGLLFLRAWQEWVGAYAIITITVALLPRGSGKADRMAESDVSDEEGEDGEDQPDMKARARWVTLTYAALTILCVLGVMATGQTAGFAVLHGLTAISTGGFSAQSSSLADVAPGAVMMLTAFTFLGAVAISCYVRPFIDGSGVVKLAATIGALIGLTVFWGLLILWAEGPSVSAYEAFHTASSAQTTTGFSVLSVSDLTDGSKLALSLSMLIGGDVGSTTGGLKLVRLGAFVALGLALVKWRRAPGAQTRHTARQGVRLIAWWAVLTGIGWPLLMLAGHGPVDSLFEWASALDTVGLSAGVSGGDAPALTRIVLIFGMWFGRVEVFGALLAFSLIAKLRGEGYAERS